MTLKTSLARFLALFLLLGLMSCGSEPDGGQNPPDSTEIRTGPDIPDVEAEEEPASSRTASLKADVPPDHAVRAEEILAEADDQAGIASILAADAYLNRHLETAAWLYAMAVDAAPTDGYAMSNLGLTLTELWMKANAEDDLSSDVGSTVPPTMMYLVRQPNAEEGMLNDALDVLATAVELLPDEAAASNNHGVALMQAGQYDEAEAAFLRAIEIDPGFSLYHAHLADLYARQGRAEEAAIALARSHALDAYDGAALHLRGRVAQGAVSIPAPPASAMSHCDALTYSCGTECPGGIIGGLQRVTCEMDQSSAVMACRAGEPYAPTYNCDIEMGGVPFLIPGLYPGMSIVTPWGQVDVLMQGGGRVDFRVRVNVPGASGPGGGLDISAAGSYDPQTGVSVSRVAPGVGVNLFNRGSVGPALNEAGIAPVAIKLEADVVGTEGTQLRLDGYNTPIVHLH